MNEQEKKIAALEAKVKVLQKERNQYKKELEEERELANEEFLQGRGSRGERRIRTNFIEIMENLKTAYYVAAWKLRVFDEAALMVLGAEEWNRLEETLRMGEEARQLLMQIKSHASRLVVES